MKFLAVCFLSVAGPIAAHVPGRSLDRGVGNITCAEAIAQHAKPASDPRTMQLVLDRVWLPRASSEIGLSPQRAGEDQFGKWGIEVLAGRPVVLEVPSHWRGIYSLVFGSRSVLRVSDGQAAVTVHSCASALGRWSSYAGGYEVSRPVCVPLTVRAGARLLTIRLSIGRRCR